MGVFVLESNKDVYLDNFAHESCDSLKFLSKLFLLNFTDVSWNKLNCLFINLKFSYIIVRLKFCDFTETNNSLTKNKNKMLNKTLYALPFMFLTYPA